MVAAASFGGADSGVLELPKWVDVCYRPIEPGDAHALQRFHGRLSQRPVNLRFFLGQARTQRQEGWILHTRRRQGQVRASGPGREEEIIAVASFDREGDVAVYATAVEDSWQGTGLALACRLIEAFLKKGVRTFTGIVLPENARMLSLLRDLGLPERLRYEGVVEHVEIDLLPQRKG